MIEATIPGTIRASHETDEVIGALIASMLKTSTFTIERLGSQFTFRGARSDIDGVLEHHGIKPPATYQIHCCRCCGSPRIVQDGNCCMNFGFEVENFYDDIYCSDCEKSVKTEEVDVPWEFDIESDFVPGYEKED